MNAAASAGSSCAISSSIFAQIGTARVSPRPTGTPRARRARPRRPRCGRSASSRFSTMQQRLGREELESAQPPRIVRRQLQRAQRRALLERGAAADQDLLLLLQLRRVAAFFRSRSSRSSRRSTTPRSARMTSSSIVRTSRAGSTEPAGCGTDGIAEHPHDVQQRVGVAERRDVEQRLRRRFARRRRRRCRRIRPSPARACAD